MDDSRQSSAYHKDVDDDDADEDYEFVDNNVENEDSDVNNDEVVNEDDDQSDDVANTEGLLPEGRSTLTRQSKVWMGLWAVVAVISSFMAAFVATPQEKFDFKTPHVGACLPSSRKLIYPPLRYPHSHLKHPSEKLAFIHGLISRRYWTVDYHADVMPSDLPTFESEINFSPRGDTVGQGQPSGGDSIIQAVHWLLYTDTRVTELDRILPRYALAFLYFFYQEQHFNQRLANTHSFAKFRNWLSPTVHECQWQGITCGCVREFLPYQEKSREDNGRLDGSRNVDEGDIICNVIIKVDLSDMGLQGPIANEWTMLSYLRELHLHNNELRIDKDDLDFKLSTLPYLKYVSLTNNVFEDKNAIKDASRRVFKDVVIDV